MASTAIDRWVTALKETAGKDAPEYEPSSEEPPLKWARRVDLDASSVAKATAVTLRTRYVESLDGFRPAAGFVERYPISFAREQAIIVLIGDAKQLYLALAEPDALRQVDVAQRLFRAEIIPVFAPRAEILKVIDLAYEEKSIGADAVIGDIDANNLLSQIESADAREDLLATLGRGPVIELVNHVLLDAVKAGASDAHFEPFRDKLVVRLRIDGVLFDSYDIPKAIQEEVLSRIKVMGKMNIAEKRLPQDGRATVKVGERMIDLRIASLPGSYGERVVLRLLDKSARLYTLAEIGMDVQTCDAFKKLIQLEHGLILLTGPTGSGKSTTLYGALAEINTRDRNVVTLEDPIEYDIEGVSQTQINTKKGLTFASGLRNVLRQDPDIIMVGEIRDQETAVMAIQSALTGHLVFSTLHTNDAASAVTRLLDLGIEPYLVSSSLLAVLAQRLVRKVCVQCGQPDVISEQQREQLGIPKDASVRRGMGCQMCRETGYAGRLAICELLLVDEAIRQKIQSHATASEIRTVALQRGMRLLRDDGVAKVLAGVTTPAEVQRVTVRTEM